MQIVIRNAKVNLDLIICYITISFFIIAGNSLTFNLGDRIPVKAAEIAAFICLLFLIPKYGVVIKGNAITRNILIFFFIGAVSSVINKFIYGYSLSDLLYGQFYSLRIIFILYVTSRIALCFINNGVDKRKFFDLIISNYLIVCVIGFWQFISYPKAYDFYRLFLNFNVYIPDPDPHIGRLISTYFDPNFLSCCLCIPLTLCIFQWVFLNKNKSFYYILIFFLGIVLTFSRSGFMGIMVTSFFSIVLTLLTGERGRKNKIFIFSVILIFSFILLILTDAKIIQRFVNISTEESALLRFVSWSSALEVYLKNPVIGIGFNMIGAFTEIVYKVNIGQATGYGFDSSLLVILTTQGTAGFLFFIINIFKTLKYSYKNILKNNLLIIIIIVVLLNLFCSVAINLMFYILWLFPFFLIVFYIYFSRDVNTGVVLKGSSDI